MLCPDCNPCGDPEPPTNATGIHYRRRFAALTPRQRFEPLWFRHLAVLVPNVADLLSVDRPYGRRVVLERSEQRLQLVIRCRLFAQLLRPILFGENDRHPIMERADDRVGRFRDNFDPSSAA
jgi:hypothetical protein